MIDFEQYATLPEYVFGELIEDKNGYKVPKIQPGKLNWYHKDAPPAIGSKVKAGRCCEGRVIGYFSEEWFLGLLVNIDTPSEWYHASRKFSPHVYCFGPEFTLID